MNEYKHYAIIVNDKIKHLVYSDTKPETEHEVIEITESTFNLLGYGVARD